MIRFAALVFSPAARYVRSETEERGPIRLGEFDRAWGAITSQVIFCFDGFGLFSF